MALWLTMRLLQCGKFFRLEELPEFSREVVQVEGHHACING